MVLEQSVCACLGVFVFMVLEQSVCACLGVFVFIMAKWHSQILPDLCYVGEHVCFLRVAGNYYHSFMYINYVFRCSPHSLPADARQSFVHITIVFMLNHCHRSWSAVVFGRKACGNMSFSSQSCSRRVSFGCKLLKRCK